MAQPLSLYLPAPLYAVTQPFAANATSIYKEQGLTGHASVDWGIKHGAPILNLAEGLCYSVKNKDNADPMRYRAVYMLVEGFNGKTDLTEVSYGHLDKIDAVPGKRYGIGAKLGTCGNTGDVFSGGRYVTKEEKLAGSTAGTHLHGPQVRPVKKVRSRSRGKTYLTTANGYYLHEGSYLEVVDYDNGTNGCIDPKPFFNGLLASAYKPPAPPPAPVTAPTSLVEGLEHPIVMEAQETLKTLGYFPAKTLPTNFWGPVTEKAHAAFRKATGLRLAVDSASTGVGDGDTISAMEEKKYGALSSSVNPQELSLSVQASLRSVAGILVFVGVATATDADTLIEQIGIIIPLAFAIWNAAETVYGLIRKVVVRVSKRK